MVSLTNETLYISCMIQTNARIYIAYSERYGSFHKRVTSSSEHSRKQDLGIVLVGSVSALATIRLTSSFHITHLSHHLQLGQRSVSWQNTHKHPRAHTQDDGIKPSSSLSYRTPFNHNKTVIHATVAPAAILVPSVNVRIYLFTYKKFHAVIVTNDNQQVWHPIIHYHLTTTGILFTCTHLIS